jgi:hypothetical protein
MSCFSLYRIHSTMSCFMLEKGSESKKQMSSSRNAGRSSTEHGSLQDFLSEDSPGQVATFPDMFIPGTSGDNKTNHASQVQITRRIYTLQVNDPDSFVQPGFIDSLNSASGLNADGTKRRRCQTTSN